MIVILAAGFCSVVVQLTMVRELLAGFEGNEFVISAALLLWLAAGGLGSLMACLVRERGDVPSAKNLALFTLPLAVFPVLQVMTVRFIRTGVLVDGASAGLLFTLACAGIMTIPSAFAVGYILPWSLYVLSAGGDGYPAGRVYILDCLGATLGGMIFSWWFVDTMTPMQTLLVSGMLLAAALLVLLVNSGARRVTAFIVVCVVTATVGAGVWLEVLTLKPRGAELVHYEESRFGRITLTRAQGLVTVFLDGVPALWGEDRVMAEEAVHYALVQPGRIRHVLLVSPAAGMVEEVIKYHPEAIDYARMDPALTRLELAYGLLRGHKGLTVIHEDARTYLKNCRKTYDAVLVNYPEPRTFQTNRYFTIEFMALARSCLSEGGVLGFSVEGYENYISRPAREKVSSLYKTARSVFGHVLVLPGHQVYFIASDRPVSGDIPGLLALRGIRTEYVASSFAVDVSRERINGLMRHLNPQTPLNTDFTPYLLRLAFDGWLMKHAARPRAMILVLGASVLFFMARMNSREFVLFTTGSVNMGSEILVIFLFQILFGFLYYRIGLIVTMFLAGLIPGAWIGGRIRGGVSGALLAVDMALAALMAVLWAMFTVSPQVIPEWSLYAFSFVLSVLCGIQFPLVAGSGLRSHSAAARAFSVDLMGASLGCILLGGLLVPYAGMAASCLALIGLKAASIMVQVYHGRAQATNVPAH